MRVMIHDNPGVEYARISVERAVKEHLKESRKRWCVATIEPVLARDEKFSVIASKLSIGEFDGEQTPPWFDEAKADAESWLIYRSSEEYEAADHYRDKLKKSVGNPILADPSYTPETVLFVAKR